MVNPKQISLKLFTVVLCILITNYGFAQNSLDPKFATFKGKVFQIEDELLPFGYDPIFETYESEYNLLWNNIKINDREVDEGFPEVPLRTGWGIIFKSEVMIPTSGKYSFTLNSDDGSILWIDNKKIIDNDGHHGMKRKTESIYLQRGFYPVKIFYYQAFMDRMGLEFDSKYMGKKTGTAKIDSTITFANIILFDFDKSVIREDAIHIVDRLADQLSTIQNHEIRISGHTDDLGSDAYNRDLSRRRSKAILERIQQKCVCNGLTFYTAGIGESYPLHSNETEEGRQLNRRVEVAIKPLE